jgi:pyruvate kinase
MRRSRSTKILATLGPATSTPEQIRGLFDAGADAFRLNFSHGSHEQHAERYRLLRAIEADTRRPIAAVVDLQGPKLRIDQFREGPVQLERGARFRLDLAAAPGDQSRVSLPHREIFAAFGVGSELLLDDG